MRLLKVDKKGIITGLSLSLGIFLFIIIANILFPKPFELLKAHTISWQFWVREKIFRKAPFPISPDKMLIIRINKKVTPRDKLAELIEKRLSRAKVVGIDVLMDWEYPWSDAVSKRLADAIKKAGNVILSFKLLPAADKKSFTATGYPIRVLRDTAWATGFITIPKEGETVCRLLLAAQDKNKQLHYSFPLLVLAKYKDIKKEDIEVGDVKKIKIGDLHIPVERENLLWINYHSMFREIDEEKSEYVITLDEALNTESDKFHDKIILIGKTRFKEKGRIESEAEDILPTPVGKMSGILIYANSISSILQRRFITLMSPSAQYLLLLLLILFISFSTIALKPDKSLILFSSTIVILCSFFFYSFSIHGYLIDIIPFLSSSILAYGAGMTYCWSRGERLKARLVWYVPRHVLKEVENNPEILSLEGRRMEMSLLFSDLRGFTALSDRVEPEELIKILNEYFDEMAKVIDRYEGYIDKFIGDGILAFFTGKEHPIRAVKAAVEMRQRFNELEQKWIRTARIESKRGLRIGINTGYVTMGNVGSKGIKFMDYTLIGKNVNIAAKIVDKAAPGQILITERTHALVRDFIETSLLDEQVRVKGIKNEVYLYEIKDGQLPERVRIKEKREKTIPVDEIETKYQEIKMIKEFGQKGLARIDSLCENISFSLKIKEELSKYLVQEVRLKEDYLSICLCGSIARLEGSQVSDGDFFVIFKGSDVSKEWLAKGIQALQETAEWFVSKGISVHNLEWIRNLTTSTEFDFTRGKFPTIFPFFSILKFGTQEDNPELKTRRMCILTEATCVYNQELFYQMRQELAQRYGVSTAWKMNEIPELFLGDLMSWYNELKGKEQEVINEQGVSSDLYYLKLIHHRRFTPLSIWAVLGGYQTQLRQFPTDYENTALYLPAILKLVKLPDLVRKELKDEVIKIVSQILTYYNDSFKLFGDEDVRKYLKERKQDVDLENMRRKLYTNGILIENLFFQLLELIRDNLSVVDRKRFPSFI